MTHRRLLALFAAFLISLAAVPASAGAYVFWVNGANGTIGRAHLDGSGAEPQFVNPSGAIDMTRSGNYLYFTHGDSPYISIGRVALDGSEFQPSFVPGVYGRTLAHGLAADAGHIYWSTFIVEGGEIGRGDSEGNVTDFEFIPHVSFATNLAVDGSHIYWARENWIGRANIDGTGADNFFIVGGSGIRGIVVQGDHIYWGNTGTDEIGRANLDGTGIDESFIATSGAPAGVAADAGHLYWSNVGPGTIGRANLDGSGVENSFITGIEADGAVAVAPEPPALTLDSGPSGPITDTTPSFGFTAEPGTTVTCSIDHGTPSFAPCSGAGADTPGAPLADGDYTFRVRATNAGAVATTRTRAFTVDTIAPQTTIDSGPPALSNSLAPTFTFSSSEPGSTFECSLDNGAWSTCSSPRSYSGIADGAHSFAVRAVDAAGNTDPTPAGSSFTLDTTGPETTIVSVEEVGSHTYFTFSASESGASFECSFVETFWAPCTSPASAVYASGGTFEVRAVDALGNADSTPARWTSPSLPPPVVTIEGGPEGRFAGSDVTFTFSSDQAGSVFGCNLDNLGLTLCTSPQSYTGLAVGDHIFEVFAISHINNVGAPSSRKFTVVPASEPGPPTTDPGPPAISTPSLATTLPTLPPVTRFVTSPKAKIKTKNKAATVKISFGSAVGARFECRLDQAAFKPCASPFSVKAKSRGGKGLAHTISVRATDASGNVGEPAVAAFKVIRKP